MSGCPGDSAAVLPADTIAIVAAAAVARYLREDGLLTGHDPPPSRWAREGRRQALGQGVRQAEWRLPGAW